MYARIDKAVTDIDAVDKNYIVEYCEDVTPAPLGPAIQPVSGIAFASISQANIFFHFTTHYVI
jgi:hypothetical protein